MQDFMTFVLQNWPFLSLFFVLLAVLAWFESRTTVGGITKLEPHSLIMLINHDNANVIDIRDSNAYKEVHIVGSVNIPMSQLADKNKKLQKFKGKPIAVVCTAGVTSMKIAKELKKQEFDKIYSLNGGITAWKNASLPLEKTT